MKLVNQEVKVLTQFSDGGIEELKNIEAIGRTCYKSEEQITEDGESAKKFVHALIKRGHESVLEHESISVRIVTTRQIANELVRHRIASYSQESTRYCNYSKDKFGREIKCILPLEAERDLFLLDAYISAYENCEENYMMLLVNGAKPQIAASVLPLGLATEIVVTMNYREWRHFLKLRTSKKAHPTMRVLAESILDLFKSNLPIVFDDIKIENNKSEKEESKKCNCENGKCKCQNEKQLNEIDKELEQKKREGLELGKKVDDLIDLSNTFLEFLKIFKDVYKTC